MLEAEARAQTERVWVLEERTRGLQTELADTKASMAGLERWAKDLEASLATEREKATHQAEESAAEVARLEGRSRTLHAHLEVMMAQASTVEEKATTAMALMEAAKKEIEKVVPRFKALTEFIEEVREVVVDSFLKGFANCKAKVAQAHPGQDLEAVIPNLPGGGDAEEAPSEEVGAMPVEQAMDPSTPLAKSQEDADKIPQRPSKAPTMSS